MDFDTSVLESMSGRKLNSGCMKVLQNSIITKTTSIKRNVINFKELCMAISKTKNYLVLNHSASPVSVSTKYDSFMVDGGSYESPGSLPLSFDEIAVINSKSTVFKIGLLRFEPEHEAELYEALAIPNWEGIMTQKQIEDALLNPTMETSQKILDIENEAYFERVRGTMISLRNTGADISVKMMNMVEERRNEFVRRQRKTSIRLVPNETAKTAPSQAEFDNMKNELEAMKAMMVHFMGQAEASKPENVSAPEAKKESPRQNNKKSNKGNQK